jgi:hypothetical protein
VPVSSVDLARQQWEEGYRRVESQSSDPGLRDRLLVQVEAVTAELRRRLGGPFTLAELVALYAGSDRWTQDAIAERDGRPGWERLAAAAADAAFHLYARGARDYSP